MGPTNEGERAHPSPDSRQIVLRDQTEQGRAAGFWRYETESWEGENLVGGAGTGKRPGESTPGGEVVGLPPPRRRTSRPRGRKTPTATRGPRRLGA
jgi:hypothetical protein